MPESETTYDTGQPGQWQAGHREASRFIKGATWGQSCIHIGGDNWIRGAVHTRRISFDRLSSACPCFLSGTRRIVSPLTAGVDGTNLHGNADALWSTQEAANKAIADRVSDPILGNRSM